MAVLLHGQTQARAQMGTRRGISNQSNKDYILDLFAVSISNVA